MPPRTTESGCPAFQFFMSDFIRACAVLPKLKVMRFERAELTKIPITQFEIRTLKNATHPDVIH